MAQLQTKVIIPVPDFKMNYSDKILLLGSCFSSNIGKKLSRLKFNTLANPFGVLYNPESISKNIDLLLNKNKISENELEYFDEQWFSYNFDTSFSSPDKETALKNINKAFKEASEKITTTSHLFITLGTSWVYVNKETSKVVANCHKIPANKFDRIFLEPQDTVRLLSQTIQKLLAKNGAIKIILTISPIRHWKDGAIENMRSKASLTLAIQQLEKLFPNLYYFPAYEIFMDELRDYRFYASDMLHPSEFAIEYVWEQFSNTFFEPTTIHKIKKIEKLVRSFEHRISNKNSSAYLKFVSTLIEKTRNFVIDNPNFDFSEELARLDK